MILRSALLFLSNRKRLRRWMETSSLTGRLTSRFVAGLTLEDGLSACRRLEQECKLATLDRLGEYVTSLEEAKATMEGYLEAVGRIAEEGLPASVSIKLTQFGLDLSEPACRAHVHRLVAEARKLDRMVEVDMESSSHVDPTLRIVGEAHDACHNVRAVIQAYLRRSERDIEMLCERGIPVRLCKGAYDEGPDVAFPRKADVDANYVRLVKVLLERGVYPAFATHDENMIAETTRFAREQGLAPERFEFQMLYGIRRDLSARLVRDGYRVRLYVPYGDAWYPYFMRRLAERPANLLFLLRNMLRG